MTATTLRLKMRLQNKRFVFKSDKPTVSHDTIQLLPYNLRLLEQMKRATIRILLPKLEKIA